MRHLILAAVFALGISPALADGPGTAPGVIINGAAGSRFTLAPLASSGVC